jgi:hypothetical protein
MYSQNVGAPSVVATMGHRDGSIPFVGRITDAVRSAAKSMLTSSK